MLLYSMLHLTGYGLSIEESKISGSGIAKPPVTRNTVSLRASRRPLDPLVKDLPTLLDSLSQKRFSQTRSIGPDTRSLTTARSPSVPTAT